MRVLWDMRTSRPRASRGPVARSQPAPDVDHDGGEAERQPPTPSEHRVDAGVDRAVVAGAVALQSAVGEQREVEPGERRHRIGLGRQPDLGREGGQLLVDVGPASRQHQRRIVGVEPGEGARQHLGGPLVNGQGHEREGGVGVGRVGHLGELTEGVVADGLAHDGASRSRWGGSGWRTSSQP